MYQSIITPEGDRGWMDLAREGMYLRRCREAVPGVKAISKLGRHANYNIFISMKKKMSEGDPGRAAAAALTFDHAKNVFVFDEDINVCDFHRRALGDHRHAGATAPASVGHTAALPRPRDRPVVGGRDQNFLYDCRRHVPAGSTVFSGIEVSRRSNGADQVGRVCPRRNFAAHSHRPDDLLGMIGS